MLESKAIAEYIKTYSPVWTVNMPEGCPPQEICIPTEHQFYRYALNKDSYSADDFKTYSELNPEKDWGEMLPLAVGLSIINDKQKAKNNLRLPFLKRFNGVIALCLNPTDGVVKQTGVHKSHYTWWRTESFDMSNLQMLEL